MLDFCYAVSTRCRILYRNQLFDLQSKSNDWFLYEMHHCYQVIYLLQVNDVKVLGMTHQEASAILRRTESTAKLVLGRPNDPSNFNNLFPKVLKKAIRQEHEITLHKVKQLEMFC